MKGALLQFLTDCLKLVPASVFVVGGLIFCLGTVILWIRLGLQKGIQWAAGLLLMEYFILLILLSVGARPVYPERMYNFFPFWSYQVIRAGNLTMLAQVIMNVVSFIPLGLLLGCSFHKMNWWGVMTVGGAFSLFVEILQFVFKRGMAEFDDIFHNVLGCMIGYGIYLVIKRIIRIISNKRNFALNN